MWETPLRLFAGGGVFHISTGTQELHGALITERAVRPLVVVDPNPSLGE